MVEIGVERGPMGTGNENFGHVLALFTMILWGTTLVSTKVLLVDFTPLEILIFRFALGSVALTLIYPKRLKGTTRHQELMFMAAGLCGVTLYFLLENIALTYTLASHTGIILSASPFITAMLAHRFLKDERLRMTFFIGFTVAVSGIILINLNGILAPDLNPLGDLLALSAATVWAFYSILMKKISSYEYNMIQCTRRTFFYGLMFMLPAILFLPFELDLGRFADPVNLFNILFLGLGASAMCFVTWNTAVKRIGAVKTNMYLYMLPTVTIITALIVLDEQLTWLIVCGAALTMIGLFISENKAKRVNRLFEK